MIYLIVSNYFNNEFKIEKGKVFQWLQLDKIT